MELCKNNINKFCYVCGHFTVSKRKNGYFSAELKLAYEAYFNQIVISGVPWVPTTICKTCYNYLLQWQRSKRKSMPFGTPMIWIHPEEHNSLNCYACVNTVRGLTKKNMKKFVYKSVASAQIPLPHSEIIPSAYKSPDVYSVDTFNDDFTEGEPSIYQYEETQKIPTQIPQNKLNYIVAKLELTQRKSEELASFLNEFSVLTPDTKITAFRRRQSELQTFYKLNVSKTFAYCENVSDLFAAMDIIYKPEEWRLFIDSSTTSLKAVLLHITNIKPPIPIAYSTDKSETYQSLEMILKLVNYEVHQWRICCDLKVVAMLCGLQSGYVKHMCFMCDWDSRFKGNQYAKHDWSARCQSVNGDKNLIRSPLVPKDKIILPPLHIKLGIVKNFIKTIAKNIDVLECLQKIFPGLSQAKISNGNYLFIYIKL